MLAKRHLVAPVIYPSSSLLFHYPWGYNEIKNNPEMLPYPPQRLSLKKRKTCPRPGKPEHFTPTSSPLTVVISSESCT